VSTASGVYRFDTAVDVSSGFVVSLCDDVRTYAFDHQHGVFREGERELSRISRESLSSSQQDLICAEAGEQVGEPSAWRWE
jgi:hypothetical protein